MYVLNYVCTAFTANAMLSLFINCIGNDTASSIELTVRDLPPGFYNLTINATDIYGQTAKDTVFTALTGATCILL